MGFFSWLWSGVKEVASTVWQGIVAVGKTVVKVIKEVWIAIRPLVAFASRWIADHAMRWVERLLPQKLKWLAGFIRIALYWLADKLEQGSDEEVVVQFLLEIERIINQTADMLELKVEIEDFEEYARLTTSKILLEGLRDRLIESKTLDGLDNDDIRMVSIVKEIVDDKEIEGTATELDQILDRKGQRNSRSIGMEQLFSLWTQEYVLRIANIADMHKKTARLEQEVLMAEDEAAINTDAVGKLQKLKSELELAKNEKNRQHKDLMHLKLLIGVAEALLTTFDGLEDGALKDLVLKAANLLFDWHKGAQLSEEEIELLEDLAIMYIPQARERARKLGTIEVNV